MSDENWEKATDLFHEALRMDSGERSAFLIRECDGNVALREEVESLIRAASESLHHPSELFGLKRFKIPSMTLRSSSFQSFAEL